MTHYLQRARMDMETIEYISFYEDNLIRRKFKCLRLFNRWNDEQSQLYFGHTKIQKKKKLN